MAYRIKLREEVHGAKLRDGKGFTGRVKALSTKTWTRFENLPSVDDPNLIIEEIKKVPIVKFETPAAAPATEAPSAPETKAPKAKKTRRRRKKTE